MKSNRITKIEANSFNGLLNLTLIDLLNNPINEIDSNGFNNTNFKEIRLSIPNITIEMIHLFKDKLKPNFAYNHWIYDYYDSIYIENRQDINCYKTLFLIKYKLFYNFIFDYYDINDITSNCMNLSKLRDTLNRYNDNVYHINYIPTESIYYNGIRQFYQKHPQKLRQDLLISKTHIKSYNIDLTNYEEVYNFARFCENSFYKLDFYPKRLHLNTQLKYNLIWGRVI